MKWWRGGKKTEEPSGNRSETDSASSYAKKEPKHLEKYDCYSILGVTHNADDIEIKRAYRRLALQYHPDRNKSPEATAIFTVVQMAYDTLIDPDKKRQYDATIPQLDSVQQVTIKAVLEGAWSEADVMDDHASISIAGSDEYLVF